MTTDDLAKLLDKKLEPINSELKDIRKQMVTKDELKVMQKQMATKDELKVMQKQMATKKDLKQFEQKIINKLDYYFHQLDTDIMIDRKRLDRLEPI